MPGANFYSQMSVPGPEPVWLYAHPSMYDVAAAIQTDCDCGIADGVNSSQGFNHSSNGVNGDSNGMKKAQKDAAEFLLV